MDRTEALAILADPEGHEQADIDAAELLVMTPTDNQAQPDEGPQPEQDPAAIGEPIEGEEP